jgi:hypothetical protein
MLLTAPDGGVTDLFVRGAVADEPLGKCVGHLLGKVRTPSYNGASFWLLVDYVVPNSE